ncbi:MAG: acylphosphatase [Pseudomonadota bacterium]
MSTAYQLRITGRVQGVGFRYWTRDRAQALGLSGWVRNEPDGSVSALIAGPAAALDQMLEDCKSGPPGAAVRDVAVQPAENRPESDPDSRPPSPFEIRR